MRIEVSEAAWKRIRAAREIVDEIIESKRVVYGINTGFGRFATTVIAPENLTKLQENLILSHAAGTGAPLSPERTRALLIVRINVLCKGYSGITPSIVERLVFACNELLLAEVPEQGTVGASGDLAPLSHLAAGLLGHGQMWDIATRRLVPAADVLASHGFSPLVLNAKDGLSLINGTQFICAIAAEALVRAQRLVRVASITAALTLEALQGTPRAYDEEVHRGRPHPGQLEVARQMRVLLGYPGSESGIYRAHLNCGKVQDAYTLRCVPQVHGASLDIISYVERSLQIEINSATDNPVVLLESRRIVSSGQFHGEYPAKAADMLTIAVHELGQISERRQERMLNPHLSEHLPAFLSRHGGLNSGFMISHCTSAALNSESKTLCFPASSDSQSTSASREDHVSMGGWAARKALRVVENVEVIIALELMMACQGFEFLRPLESTPALEEVYKTVRARVRNFDEDRFVKPDQDAMIDMVRSGVIERAVKMHLPNF